MSKDDSQHDILQSLIAQILDAEAQGELVDREELLRNHPQHEASLKEFFSNHDSMKAVGDQEEATLPPTASAADELTLPPSQTPTEDITLPPTATARSETQVGDKIRYFGDYELLEEIARGGMGVVYKARQVNLNRVVALKMILSGQLASEEDVQRFYTEAEAAANLDHPGIVPIFEIGEHQGQHYFSMGYIEGQSLADKVADGPLPPREAAELVKKICEAMAYAHERGVIHRDLKPANILIDQNGQPKVTDFGLAKRTEADSNLTGTGQILGTPSYMAPEQAGGKVEEVDQLADVYALGAILYCLLTGRPPFQAANPMDTLLQVIDKEPLSIRLANPAVPIDVETISLKCLQKEPEKRYDCSADLADELSRFLSGTPIHARPIGNSERLWRWSKRNPAKAGLVGTLTFVFTVLLPVVLVIQFGLIQQRDDAIQESILALDDTKAAKVEAESAQRIAEDRGLLARRYWYFADLQLAQNAWQANKSGRSLEALIRHVPEPGTTDLRGFEWRYLYGLCRSTSIIQEDHENDVFCVRYSADGSQILSTGTFDKTVRVRSSYDGATAAIYAAHNDVVYDASFCHFGTKVLSCSRNKEIHLWRIGSQAADTILKSSIIPLKLALSADQTMFAVAGLGGIEIWSMETLKRVYHIKRDMVSGIAFHPKSELLFYGDVKRERQEIESGLVVFDLKEQKQSTFLPCHDAISTCIEFSDDGNIFVSGSMDSSAIVWDAESMTVRARLEGHSLGVQSVSVSFDGKQIATASKDKTICIWNTDTGTRLRRLQGHEDSVESIHYSPNKLTLVSGGTDSSVRIWQTSRDQERTLIRAEDEDAIKRIAFVPDGSIITGSSDGDVSQWDTKKMESLQHWGSVSGSLMSLEVMRDPLRVAAAGLGSPSISFWASRGADHRTIEIEGGVGARFSVSPDMRFAAVIGRRGRVSILDLDSGQQELMDGNHEGPVYAVSWHPNGDRFATGSYDKTIRIWDVASRSMSQLLHGHALAVVTLDFNSDGSLLASGSASPEELESRQDSPTPGTIRLWNMTDENPSARILKGHSAGILCVDFSPDDRTLASSSHEETIRLWEPSTGSEVMRLTTDAPSNMMVVFSPDGSQLATGGSNGSICIWTAPLAP